MTKLRGTGARRAYEMLRLLQSALAQPQASFGDQLLHPDLCKMAAAYLFHLVQNHPFIDGNKRVGTVAAIVFLALNGLELDVSEDELETLVMNVVHVSFCFLDFDIQ